MAKLKISEMTREEIETQRAKVENMRSVAEQRDDDALLKRADTILAKMDSRLNEISMSEMLDFDVEEDTFDALDFEEFEEEEEEDTVEVEEEDTEEEEEDTYSYEEFYSLACEAFGTSPEKPFRGFRSRLCEELGIAKSYPSMYKSGQLKVSEQVIEKLAEWIDSGEMVAKYADAAAKKTTSKKKSSKKESALSLEQFNEAIDAVNCGVPARQRGWQSRMSEKLGVSQAYLSQILSGKTSISAQLEENVLSLAIAAKQVAQSAQLVEEAPKPAKVTSTPEPAKVEEPKSIQEEIIEASNDVTHAAASTPEPEEWRRAWKYVRVEDTTAALEALSQDMQDQVENLNSQITNIVRLIDALRKV